jgi:hypothetical protein
MSLMTFLVKVKVTLQVGVAVNVLSENESGSEGSDDDNTSNGGGGAATWVKVDKTPTLGQFTGNPG